MPLPNDFWHQRRDTLLRLTEPRHDSSSPNSSGSLGAAAASSSPYCSVYIPVGITPGSLGRQNIVVEYKFDQPYYFESTAEFNERMADDSAGNYLRVGFDTGNHLGGIKRISPDFIAQLRYRSLRSPDAESVRPYLEMERVFNNNSTNPPSYYEARLDYIPKGAKLSYRIKLYDKNNLPNTIPPQSNGPAWFSVYVETPTFDSGDIKYCCPNDKNLGDVNIVYWKVTTRNTAAGAVPFLTIRVDFLDTANMYQQFNLSFIRNDGMPIASGTLGYTSDPPDLSSWKFPVFPIINSSFDYVTLTLPMTDVPNLDRIVWGGTPIGRLQGGNLVTIDQGPNCGKDFKPIRLMFVHYANQSLNDLFESPNKNYTPHRTFIQTTMRDELGTYCFRPDANETGIGQGYSYVLQIHVANGLPCLWAMNGGFLSMLAQDSRVDVNELASHFDDGLFEPAIAGFGGHRMLYLHSRTNQEAVQTGIELIENLLGGTSAVFFPNSRLYAATQNIETAINNAVIHQQLVLGPNAFFRSFVVDPSPRHPIKFVVADQQGYQNYASTITNVNAAVRPLWGCFENAYIWRQQCSVHRGTTLPCTPACSTWYWLFGTAKMKDQLLSAGTDEWQAGKLGIDLRKHFFYGVSHPDLANKSLFAYCDDLDHCAATGWFDGDYDGHETPFVAIFSAAMEWIAAHPWLKVVSAADLDPENDAGVAPVDRECVGTIFVQDTIDPNIDISSGWSAGYPGDHGMDLWSQNQIARTPMRPDLVSGFEYARWYHEWRNSPANWLGRTLGAVGDVLEDWIMPNPVGRPENELDRVARLAFLIAIHEAHWSKKPLELFVPEADYNSGNCGGSSKAAYQRTETLEPEDFVLSASLQVRHANVFLCAARWADLVLAGGIPGGATYKDGGPLQPVITGMMPGYSWLQWDLDITPNVILYNEQLLVVMDSNGGRITHIFTVRNGRPVVVSGNIKSYQFLGDDRTDRGRLPCDGAVLQNTVYLPNHRYVATDVNQSLATYGKKYDPKTKVSTRPCGGGTVRAGNGVFGCEDWLYPDNFNNYDRSDVASPGTAVIWSYPGHAWNVAPATSAEFQTLTAQYRDYVQGTSTLANSVLAQRTPTVPTFAKTVDLVGDRIVVTYTGGLTAGHLVANEFSLDLLPMLLQGMKQTRGWQISPGGGLRGNVRGIELASYNAAFRVILTATNNCQFSADTLEGEPNLRLHRSFSDCLELETIGDGGFAYQIQIPP